jgi:hypothetical protein
MPIKRGRVPKKIELSQKEPIIQRGIPPQPPTEKKMKWGEPTWILLHSMAEKIKEESFPLLRKELLDIIYTICTNLPCPMCSEHAKAHLDSIYFKTIDTKERLKNMLYSFHNSVNKRKNMRIFPYEELTEKYENVKMIPAIQQFLHFFKERSNNIRLMIMEQQRRHIIVKIHFWLAKNIEHFM